MKRILTLILVAGMILGLAAPAWAAGFAITSSHSTTVGYDQSVTISGTMPDNTTATGTGDTKTGEDATYTVTSDVGSCTSNNGTFTLTVKGSAIGDGGTVTFTLRKTYAIYNNSQQPTETGTNEYVDDISTSSFTIAPQAVLGNSNISVTCSGSGHSLSVSGTSSFSVSVHPDCAKAGDTITIDTKNLAAGLTATIGTSSPPVTVTAGSFTTKSYTLKVENNASPKESNSYQLTLTGPSDNTELSSVTLKSGSSDVGSYPSSGSSSNPSTNSNSRTAINVSGSGTGALAITVDANAKEKNAGATAIATPATFNLGLNQSQDFDVKVTAVNGSDKTYYFRATRTGNSNILNSVSLRTATGGGGNQVDSNTTTVNGNNSSLALTVPPANSSTTNFYVNWSVPSGVTVTGVTWNNSSIHSTGSPTSGSHYFTMATNVNTGTLRITATATDGNSYTAAYTVSRSSTVNLLTSITFGSSSVGRLTNITSASNSASQSITLNTTATSSNISWVLASGATMVSYKWGSGSTQTTTNTSITSASLPSSGSTTLAIVVKVNNVNYTVSIAVSKSGTGTLSNLYIKNEATSNTNSRYLFETSPSNFSGSTYNYTVYVESDYDTIYVYPVKNNSSDSLTVDGSYSKMTNKFNASGYYEIDLKSSGNKVNITVNNGTKYVLTIERTANVVRNASLDSLKVSKSSSSTTSSNTYDLSPSFAYNRVNYSADIPKNVTEVYLHFSTYRSGLTPSVSGATKVSDGVYKATLTPNKTKTVTITVSYSGDSTKYTIDLNNGSASSTARLDKIRVASRESTNSNYQYTLSPVFDSSVLDYVALVPYTTANYVYVQATLDDDDDTLTIDGVTVDSDDWEEISITRSSGKKTSVPIKVKDDNGNTTTYNLVVVAAPKSADDTATLDSLSVRTGSSTSTALTLSPSFSSTTYNYTTSNVANTVDSVRVYAEADDSAAWVIVNGNLLSSSSDYAEVALEEGKNTIKVVVYAEDCETNKTYEITVNRGATGGSDSTLSGLEVRYGTSATQTLNLFPSFNKSTLNYNTNVDSSVAQIAFRPTTTDSTATILVKGMAETSGNWTSYNALSSGTNTFSIIVTSGDKKNMSVYTVTVERGLDVRVSSQSLKVNGTAVTCAAYNINGNNYFKLRDIAYALRGTTKNFNVGYNDSSRIITLTSNSPYTAVGGEMVKPKAAGKYQLSNQSVMKDGVVINLTAYNIDDNNYFMLREIGELFNFGVDYDGNNNTVLVDSSKIYTAPQ